MIRYKLDILNALKEKGYTQYRIRKDNIFGQRNVQQLRNNELVSWAVVDKLCRLLDCQPGDLFEYEEEQRE